MLLRTILCLGWAAILLAQQKEYEGPSILTRGLAPSNVPTEGTTIRPYAAINGIFDDGLIVAKGSGSGNAAPGNNISTLSQASGFGVEGEAGLFGEHQWKHTLMKVDYHGDYRRYSQSTFADGTDQSLNLEIDQALSKHSLLRLQEIGGTFSRIYGVGGLGYLDPSLEIPTNELFDNRVNYVSSSADYTYQKSARLSFNLGTQGFLVRRQSAGLLGVTGGTLRADIAYRFTRYSTLGVFYNFDHFGFGRGVGTSDIHTAGITYASRLARRWEVALNLGASRVESLFLERVTLSPEVSELLGESSGISRSYQLHYKPSIEARLSRDFRRSQVGFKYTRQISPGNGFYLTSYMQAGEAMFSYNRGSIWSFGIKGGYTQMSTVSQSLGTYGSYTLGCGFTRKLSRDFFLVSRLDNRRYDTPHLSLKRQPIRVLLGFGWSPGDRPIPLW